MSIENNVLDKYGFRRTYDGVIREYEAIVDVEASERTKQLTWKPSIDLKKIERTGTYDLQLPNTMQIAHRRGALPIAFLVEIGQLSDTDISNLSSLIKWGDRSSRKAVRASVGNRVSDLRFNELWNKYVFMGDVFETLRLQILDAIQKHSDAQNFKETIEL